MSSDLHLREKKKIQTMGSILAAFLDALAASNFEEIRVEDVCSKVGVSKMTFFRYFSSKEEVLDYFVMRWCYQQSVVLRKGTHQGASGIREVFRSAALMPNAEKILVAIVHYYSKLKEQPAKKELSSYERTIISQNSAEGIDLDVLSVGEIFHVYLAQIPQLAEPAKLMAYAQQLAALFFGIPFLVHIRMLGEQSLLQAYMDSLDVLLSDFEAHSALP